MLHYNSLSPSLFLQFAPEADLRLQHGTGQGSPWPKVSVPMPTFALGQAGKKLLGAGHRECPLNTFQPADPPRTTGWGKAKLSPALWSSAPAEHPTTHYWNCGRAKCARNCFSSAVERNFSYFLDRVQVRSLHKFFCALIFKPRGFQHKDKWLRISELFKSVL